MLNKIWKKFVNRETISYVITGVMTTLVDWISYALMRRAGIDYRLATGGAWAAAVLFAYVTNKFFVFRSMSLHPKTLWKEFVSFVLCRVATGLFTLAAMMVMVDGMGIRQDFICKVITSVISLVLNYLLSKLFIFKKRAEQGADAHGTE
jgi:putative flippase GtrA